MYLAALPTPGGIQIAGKTPNDGTYEQHISHMQKKINDTIAKNKELYEINPPVSKSFILKNKTFWFKYMYVHCISIFSYWVIQKLSLFTNRYTDFFHCILESCWNFQISLAT